MVKTNENFEPQAETVAIKKDNTLPIVAISLASAALLTSLFTAGMGAASATPERHQERERASISQEQEGMRQGYSEEGLSSQEGTQQRHQERNRMGQKSNGTVTEQNIPQMDGSQIQERMSGKMAPNTNTGAS